MTAGTTVLPAGLVKEIRALFPTYAAILIAVVAGSFADSHTLIATGLLAYAFGSVALGAQSFGHEYSHRTLALLLSQPTDRRRLYLYKLGVLFVMLATLAVATVLLFRDAMKLAYSPHTEPSMLVLAAACGLFMAPFLTLLCRSTLAAAVFTIAIPGLLAAGADIVGGLIYGMQNAGAIDQFKLTVFWRGMFLICTVSAIAGWRMFRRLEAIEGHADVQLPDLLTRTAAATGIARRRRHPIAALIRKDLRLQQMAFVVAALYVVLWAAFAWMASRAIDKPMGLLIPLTLLYGGSLALLIGSLASAEERQLGTLEWQTLLPIPAWQQWAVKVSVTFGLALVLGAGLPALLHTLDGASDYPGLRIWFRFVPIFVLLTAISLYLSTLCRSAVGAMVVSFPTIAAVFALAPLVQGQLYFFLLGPDRLLNRGLYYALQPPLAMGAGLVGLLLWLAFLNHRSADRSATRTAKQGLVVVGYFIVCALFLAARAAAR
jgi:hypothetical protein